MCFRKADLRNFSRVCISIVIWGEGMTANNTEDDKIACYTPTKGRDNATRIPQWKYECVRRAILDVLGESEGGQVAFKNLAEQVKDHLTSNQLAKLGSLGWHVTTVKLNMEVDGELERVPRKTPQTLRKPLG